MLQRNCEQYKYQTLIAQVKQIFNVRIMDTKERVVPEKSSGKETEKKQEIMGNRPYFD